MKRFWRQWVLTTAVALTFTAILALVPAARATPGVNLLLNFAANAFGFGQPISGGVAGNCLQVSGSSTLTQGACATTGIKLRQAYQAASSSGNYIDNSPWFACVSGNNANLLEVCSAWQASTTYQTDAVVSNGGNLYVANVAGTSAASGGPSGTGNAVITDGTVNWYYLGPPRTTANDANAPAISVTTGLTPLGAGNLFFSMNSYSAQYSAFGAVPSYYTGYFAKLSPGNSKNGTVLVQGGQYCVLVNDNKFAVTTNSGGSGYGLTVDGRLLSPQYVNYSAGNPSDLILDFTSVQGQKTHTVCFYGTKSNAYFGGVFTTAAGSVTPAPGPALSGAFVYDSYDQGSGIGPYSAFNQLSQQVGARLGVGMFSLSVGGTGPQNPGASFYNYQQRIADSTNAANLANVSMVVTNISTNDAGCTGTVTATCPTGREAVAMTNLLSGIRAINPTALIVVFGPAPINSSPGYATFQSEDATYGPAVTSWSDPAGTGRVCYVPWANASVLTPIIASYMTGVPSGLPSTAQVINTSDGTHPYDFGTVIIAKWMATQIATQCYPNLK